MFQLYAQIYGRYEKVMALGEYRANNMVEVIIRVAEGRLMCLVTVPTNNLIAIRNGI